MTLHNDPFFRTRQGQWGVHSSYLEDIARTYKQSPITASQPLPDRTNETYERALQFRKNEKEHYSDLERNYRQLHSISTGLFTAFHENKSKLDELVTTNSKLQKELEDERANRRRDSSSAGSAVPQHAGDGRVADAHTGKRDELQPGGPEGGERKHSVPEPAPNLGRHSGEHDAEGRHVLPNESNDSGSVAARDPDVPTGGSE